MPTGSQTPDFLQDRCIRIFISSTFRDMQEERDHLAKFIFPQLRRLCEQRGVTWGEVDLRWGVTDEQKSEGKVLPICLEEIHRCRPYFIGLLGERYGWIPDAVPPEVMEREPWLGEHVREGKSVTELEILHGVLNNPAMRGHSLFYFRDPAYVQSLPVEERGIFLCESAEHAGKLRHLKDRIRASALPVRENYPDPKGLGELVLGDLTAIIDQQYPEGSQPDPLDREAMDHEAYARSRTGVYIGRPEYFERLDAYTADSSDQPLVILGESGSGKSALLANWAARYRREHPDTLLIQHFIGASPYSADWTAMLRRIMGEFKRRLGIDQEIPDHPDALRSTFPNWLHMAAARVVVQPPSAVLPSPSAGSSGKIVLILDALNQLEDRDGAPDLVWLPPVMPENVRLIVSTLPGRPLDEIAKRGWPVMEVKPLAAEERRDLICQYLARSAKSLSPVRVDRIASAPQSANPLYLRVLLDELRLLGEHERLNERIDYYLRAETPYDLYAKVIVRWEEDYEGDSDLVGDSLTLLWAARRGLSETELLEALGYDGQPLPRAEWSPLYLAMADGLVSRGGLLTFAHDFLRTAARDAYLPGEVHQRDAHLRLASYFESQILGPRRLDELPWQLSEAAAWQHLYNLLCDLPFFQAAWYGNPFDVKVYWARIEANCELRMLDGYRQVFDAPWQDLGGAWTVSVLLGHTGHHPEALALQEYFVGQFRQTGDQAALAAALGNQANTLYACGDADGAMRLHKEEELICRELGDKSGLAHSLNNQALILRDWGVLDGAMALHKEQERICRELGDRAGVKGSMGNQALILQNQGDLDGAMTMHQEEERICRELDDKKGLGTSLGNQGNILYSHGDLDRAMELWKELERISRALGEKDGLARSLGNQANILCARGHLERAMGLCEEQEQLCRELGHKVGLRDALCNEAHIQYARGDRDAAMALHTEEEQICRELKDKTGLQRSLGNQALVHRARGDLDRAMALLKEQERICRELGNKAELQRSLGNQALIFYDREDLAQAMALMKEQERICREMNLPEWLAMSLANQAALLGNKMDCVPDALPLAREAHCIATTHGLTALAEKIANAPPLHGVKDTLLSKKETRNIFQYWGVVFCSGILGSVGTYLYNSGYHIAGGALQVIAVLQFFSIRVIAKGLDRIVGYVVSIVTWAVVVRLIQFIFGEPK